MINPTSSEFLKVNKPYVLYDSQCSFCSKSMERWKLLAGERVDFIPSNSQLAKDMCSLNGNSEQGLRYSDHDGKLYQGAEAVLRLRAKLQQGSRLLTLYLKVPQCRYLADRVYAFIACHRKSLGFLSQWFAPQLEHSRFELTSILFTKTLALVYLVAFISLNSQMLGLVGSEGISPAGEYFSYLWKSQGWTIFFKLPSVFWLSSADVVLLSAGALGIMASILAFIGLVPGAMFLFLWGLYLSFVNVTNDFLSFQWDQLRLEAGFLAAFYSPWKIGGWKQEAYRGFVSSKWIRGMLFWLLFRVLFFSGLIKLRWMDASWIQGHAIEKLLSNQPLPTAAAWYASKLPSFLLTAGSYGLLLFEILVPIFMLGPRKFRPYLFALLVLEQTVMMVFGNCGFLNLLVISLSFILLADEQLPKWALRSFTRVINLSFRTELGYKSSIIGVSILIFAVLGTAHEVPRALGWGGLEAMLKPGNQILRPLGIFNTYGLFGQVPRERYELVIEGSNNRFVWFPYEFAFKPGNPSKFLPWITSHNPRLDWQCWLAAMSNYHENTWILRLADRLLKGSKPVLRLLSENPFPEGPPKYIQAILYRYEFSTWSEKQKTGAWWRRDKVNVYLPAVSLQNRT